MNTSQQHRSTWGSHAPINKALMKTFDVSGVMELGMGYNSTPLFNEFSGYVVSIETDKQWIDEMAENGVKETENHKIIHFETPHGIVRQTRRWNLSQDILDDLDNAAKELWRSHLDDRLNMLFIDSISSLRYTALVNLHQEFDIIVCHDYEEKKGQGRHLHWDKGSFVCPDSYQMYIDKTYFVETAFLIKKDLITDEKMTTLREELEAAVKDWANSPRPPHFEVL